MRVADPKACQCGEVLKGVLKPWECKVFGTACTPETPIGTCMVSPEGACAAYYNFGRMNRRRESGSEHLMSDGATWVDQALREHAEHTQGRPSRGRRSRPANASSRSSTGSTGPGAAGPGSAKSGSRCPTAPGARPPGPWSRRFSWTRSPIRCSSPMEDAAQLHLNGCRVALTTDSYVVSPLFFPGGDIGDLAVNGTVNDLAVSGATPLYLSAGFILEEGFPVADLIRDRGLDAGRRPGRRGAGGHRRHQGGAARARRTAATSTRPGSAWWSMRSPSAW